MKCPKCGKEFKKRITFFKKHVDKCKSTLVEDLKTAQGETPPKKNVISVKEFLGEKEEPRKKIEEPIDDKIAEVDDFDELKSMFDLEGFDIEEDIKKEIDEMVEEKEESKETTTEENGEVALEIEFAGLMILSESIEEGLELKNLQEKVLQKQATYKKLFKMINDKHEIIEKITSSPEQMLGILYGMDVLNSGGLKKIIANKKKSQSTQRD